jgi:molybdopterin adenylyltransferase
MKMYKLGIITCSDKGFKGIRVDESGKFIKENLEAKGYTLCTHDILPDELDTIKSRLIELSDREQYDLIITTGGTGITKRDVTPDATRLVIDKEIPGISEVMRIKAFDHTPFSVLSRAIVGYRKNTLIVNLPGSLKAVTECLNIISPVLDHAIKLINSQDLEHLE